VSVNELIHSRIVFNALIPRSRSVVIDSSVTVVQLVTHDCIRGVGDPLYHARHYSRHRQYECDRGIRLNDVVVGQVTYRSIVL